jgi:hypothetical protein
MNDARTDPTLVPFDAAEFAERLTPNCQHGGARVGGGCGG